MRPRTLLISAALFAAGAFAPRVHAQPQPPATPSTPPEGQPDTQPTPPTRQGVPPELEPYEGRLVRQVTLRTPERVQDGQTTPGQALDQQTESLARNQLRLREGAPFSALTVSDDIARLDRLGRFKRVESRVQLLSDGSVELVYVLDPRPVVTAVQTVGNRAFGDKDLVAGDAMVGAPIDPAFIERIARGIEARYQAKGYANALVTVDQKELDESGIVLFRIREGERTRITLVQFEGNVSHSDRELQGAIKTKAAFLLNKVPLDEDTLAQDVTSLIQFYRDRGYLDIRVGYRVFPSPNGKEAIVQFDVDEGRVYTLRSVQSILPDESAPIFTNEQLLGLMESQPGDVYSEAKLKRSVDAIKDAYGKLGYYDAKVDRRENRDVNRPFVDVVLIITQGRRWKTGLIEVQGNDITKDEVVRRQLTILPDRPLDNTEIRESERRLRQTQLFDRQRSRITPQPEDPDNPGYRDVLVEIEETNTGKFSMGGSVGSDGGVVGLVSLQQNNFDITDFPDTFGELVKGNAFRGGGQQFTIAAMPGTETGELSASLTDPYLFGTDYTGSVSAYYRTRDFRSYDEQRVGAFLSLGRRFGSRWTFSVPLRAEQVQLTSFEDNAPVDYFEVEDPQLLTAIGVNLQRRTLDDPYLPTRGTRIAMGVDQYLGDWTFNRITAEYDTYIPLSEDVLGRATVLRLSTSARYIPQGQEDVPFYERFYLGGSNFRGFKYRGASPAGRRADGSITDDPVGGIFSFFAGAEVRQPVWEDVVSIVGFIDSGTVDTELAFDDYRVSVGVGLRIYVPALSPVPLAFDFGFPLLKQETDEKRVFTFTVDFPFR
ncbi:MAG TPA: outer membrane protein assembly factor BamA [Phycisphaerales bacterium]|nr:outer membrane protein assembly factor BamA [Phycisphaerales bacterium]